MAVSSEPGRGSCFTVWLPWREAANAHRLLPRQEGRERVALVVEDDDRAAALMALQLQAQGFRTRRAVSAEQALSLEREMVPDLVTLDIELPGMDGWEFMARMKQLPRWESVPVVVVYTKDFQELHRYIEYPAIYHKDRIRGHQQAARPGESADQARDRGMREFAAMQASPFFDVWASAAVDEILSAIYEKRVVS